MSIVEADVVRWTPNRIRKALALPKPRHAIQQMWDYQSGRLVGRPKTSPLDLRLLAYIAGHADLLDVPRPPRKEQPAAPDGWLLLPAPQWVIDALATFGSETDDHEPDADLEVDADREPCDEECDGDCDAEPGGVVVTEAKRDRYRGGSEGDARRELREKLRALIKGAGRGVFRSAE